MNLRGPCLIREEADAPEASPITVTGTELSDVRSVTVDSTPVPFEEVSETSLTASTPQARRETRRRSSPRRSSAAPPPPWPTKQPRPRPPRPCPSPRRRARLPRRPEEARRHVRAGSPVSPAGSCLRSGGHCGGCALAHGQDGPVRPDHSVGTSQFSDQPVDITSLAHQSKAAPFMPDGDRLVTFSF